MNDKALTVVGGGLAGAEAAWQAAQRGIHVTLYEMRPTMQTPVHKTTDLAELVCSNSLGTNDATKAPGLLKQELRELGSLLMQLADACKVPAGQALAVDRKKFSQSVTDALVKHPRITLIREEKKEIPDGICIIATGPLTSSSMAKSLQTYCGNYLYYYDAVSPIVTKESLDFSNLYYASRYGHGNDQAYLNIPFSKEEYYQLVTTLKESEKVPYAPHEDPKFFESCMPIEELVERGPETLRFGPMKPVGLKHPATGKTPFAVLQLRQENIEGTLYNLVGFQTRMKWGEQERVFRMIPGFSNAEFVRLGVMHRNLFVNAPTQLIPTMQLKNNQNIFLAGQITGVEGYVEDIASGFLAGLNATRLLAGEAPFTFPRTTAIGALMHYITHCNPETFQPININLSLFPALETEIKNKQQKHQAIVERAQAALRNFAFEEVGAS